MPPNKIAKTQKIIGKLPSCHRLANTVAIFFEPSMPHVEHTRQSQSKGISVRLNASERHSAEIDAMVSSLTTDKPRTISLASLAVPSERYFHCSVCSFRSGVCKEAERKMSWREGR